MSRIVAGIAAFAAVLAVSAQSPPTVASSRASQPCGSSAAGTAACQARPMSIVITLTPSGYGPADIRSAYSLSAKEGRGRTVAIVNAYNDPTAAADLAVYRKAYGLPACTAASPSRCFRKVNQNGGSSMPKTDARWAAESSLDIEMVSAACPACKILLVQARTNSMADLGAAVNYAATQKVSAISNSWGTSDLSYASAFDHPGIAVVAAAGDSGYGAGAPASFSTVIAVGGTTLTRSKNARGWTEKAWSKGGSLCAKGTAKPGWQTGATRCRGKALADVSAVADGVAVYAGTKYYGVSGWQVFGGTSIAAPIIGAVYAMSGRTAGYPASYTWAHSSGLNDVTTGTNGSCEIPVWCNARTGWDGPTGLGTPHGTGSF